VKVNRGRVELGVGVVGFMAFGWWVTAQPPFSTAATVGVLVAGVALIVFATWHRRRESRPAPVTRSEARAGLLLWVVVLALVLAWELFTLFQHPRSAHPTVSSISDPLQAQHVARWLLFGGWLGLGWTLAS